MDNNKIKRINIKNHIHYYINDLINTCDLNFKNIVIEKNVR